MKEFREIINSYKTNLQAGRRMALGTVVHVDGSSYRRPGARILIDDLGQVTGSISGGCLEGDALRKAQLVISQQQSKLVTYDTSDEEDAVIGMQLGCEGIIQVLFEPIDQSAAINPIKLLEAALQKRQNVVLVTLFDIKNKLNLQRGTCLLMEEDKSLYGDIQGSILESQVVEDARKSLEIKQSSFIQYEVEEQVVNAFIEFIIPPIFLIVFGAGNDAIPMVNLAEALGWQTMVIDGRNNLIKPERFSSSCQIMLSKPEKVLDKIEIDHRTAFVLMTHNYNYDYAMLKTLIDTNARYIGSLGPKKKLVKMLDGIMAEGFSLTNEQQNKIYGPVGLEIGAETAEEIALSIIAEIQAVFNDKKGGMLREKTDVIHSRKATNISYNKMKFDA